MNFLSNFSKHKKAIFFVILILTVAGFLTPVASAQNMFTGTAETLQRTGEATNPNSQVNTNPSGQAAAPAAAVCTPGKDQWCCYNPGYSTANGGVNGCIVDQPPTYIGGIDFIVAAPVIWLGQGILWSSFRITGYSSYVLSYVFFKIVNNPITTNPNFIPAWAGVRNLANMLIVLGFVVVGIATALRIKAYAAGQLLWKLILIALVVNFSGLFCGLIIDASNLATTGIMGGGGTSDATTSNTATVQNTGEQVLFKIYNGIKGDPKNGPLTKTYAQTNVGAFVGYCFLAGFIYLAVAFTFLYMSVILIARYVILIILFVLSPLAFASSVFPASKSKWTDWWGAFLKWSFVGIFGAFTLWLTTIQVNVFGKFGSASDTIISCAIILGFLYVGFKMTVKQTGLAQMASTAIMGLAGGVAGFAIGATGKVAGVAANKLGVSKAASRLSGGVGRALERVGLKQAGSTAASAEKEIADSQKSVGNLSLERQAELAKSPMSRISSDATKNKVAAIKNLADKGELGKIGDTEKQSQALAFVESYEKGRGASFGVRKAAEKSNPQLARYNAASLAKIRIANPGITNASDIQDLAVMEAHNKLNVGEVRKIEPNNITAHALTGSVDKTVKAAAEMSNAQRQKYQNMCDPTTAEGVKTSALHGKLMAAGRIKEADNIASHITELQAHPLI